MKRLTVCFLFLLILGTACSVQIYDLQPLIMPSNTPFAVRPTVTPLVAKENVTRVAPTASVTKTPPIHVAPTEILHVEEINVLALHMIDGGVGWGVGQMPGQQDKLFIRTTDGGNTWRNITPREAVYNNAGVNPDPVFCAMDSLNARLLFWSSQDRNLQDGIPVWRTDDGGVTWESSLLQVSEYTIQYFHEPQIGFAGNRIGWILAKLGNSAGREYVGLYTTYDGGESWNTMVSPDSGNLPSVGDKTGAAFINALDGWISSTGSREEPDAIMWRTTDGGNTWGKLHVPSPQDAPEDLFTNSAYTCSFSAPKFINEQYQVAWMTLRCSENGSRPIGSYVYWTYDTMNSWKAYRLPAPEGELTFYGIDRGWYTIPAEGEDNYQILYTGDGGVTWNPIANTHWTLRAEFMTQAVGFGIATYRDVPFLMKTDNGGYGWDQIRAQILP